MNYWPPPAGWDDGEGWVVRPGHYYSRFVALWTGVGSIFTDRTLQCQQIDGLTPLTRSNHTSEKWNRKASDCFWSSYAVYWWRSCQYQSVTMQRTLLDSTRLDCRLISLYYWEPGKLSAPSLFLFWHSKFSDFWRSKNTIKLENYFYCLLFRPGLACFPNSSWHHPLNKITQQCLQSFPRNNYDTKYHHYIEGRDGMEVNQQDLYFFFWAKINIMMSSKLTKLYLFLSKNIWKKNTIITIIINSKESRALLQVNTRGSLSLSLLSDGLTSTIIPIAWWAT